MPYNSELNYILFNEFYIIEIAFSSIRPWWLTSLRYKTS